MQRFTRDKIRSHDVGADWPQFLGAVQLGESFVIETEQFNNANGPIAITDIKAGDAIAVLVEEIEILPPFDAPNGGPFFEGMGDSQPLTYEDGYFRFPNHFRLKARPSIGNIAVLPEPSERIIEMVRTDPLQRGWRRIVNDPRGKHCHQDCQYLQAGARIHLKAQVDGAGLCAADVHGYIGQGEVAFAGIEVNASLQLRVERSEGWLVDWPLVETNDELMLFCSDTNLLDGRSDQTYVDAVREAYRAMRAVVAARIGDSIEAANPIVATALDIRNCAIYGLGNYIQKDGKTAAPDQDIAVLACLSKDVFVR
jgi:acetamidase/formamidase